jgi:hypothetical protein
VPGISSSVKSFTSGASRFTSAPYVVRSTPGKLHVLRAFVMNLTFFLRLPLGLNNR